MKSRTIQLGLGATSVASVTLALLAAGTPANASDRTPRLGFTPITSSALSCSAGGLIQFANNSSNAAVTPTVLLRAGDAASPVNAPATSTKVGRENDMIALSPDGTYLFTSSENANPSDTGARLRGQRPCVAAGGGLCRRWPLPAVASAANRCSRAVPAA